MKNEEETPHEESANSLTDQDSKQLGRRESLRWAVLGTVAATGLLCSPTAANAQQRITLASLQAEIDELEVTVSEIEAEMQQEFPLNGAWPALPANALDLITVESIQDTAGYSEHGAFRFWLELHPNSEGSGNNYAWAVGMVGDGIATNRSIMVWETSYDTGGGWKTDEFYWVKRHPGSAWWPGDRRIGPCFSTYSTNRGGVANGTAIGYFNLDNVEFHSDQPSVDGSKSGWNYANLYNNYETGTAGFYLQSHPSNYSQFILSVDATGTAINATNLSISCTGHSLQLAVGDFTLAIDSAMNTAAMTGAQLIVEAPGVGGEAPGMQIVHAGFYYGYQNLELRTKAANQVSGIGLWNFNTPIWSIQNRGDQNDRFGIYNVNLDQNALTIDAVDNMIGFGRFKPAPGAIVANAAVASSTIVGSVQIRTIDGTIRKLAVIN